MKNSIYMQPLQLKDKDGNVIYGGKESTRNIAAYNLTTKMSNTPKLSTLQDGEIIMKRNKSPMLAGLGDKTKKQKKKFTQQMNIIRSSKSQTTSGKNAFIQVPKHDHSEYLHDDSLLLPLNESIEERDGEGGRLVNLGGDIVNINVNSRFNMGAVDLSKNGHGSSGNVSSKRYLSNDYENQSPTPAMVDTMREN